MSTRDQPRGPHSPFSHRPRHSTTNSFKFRYVGNTRTISASMVPIFFSLSNRESVAIIRRADVQSSPLVGLTQVGDTLSFVTRRFLPILPYRNYSNDEDDGSFFSFFPFYYGSAGFIWSTNFWIGMDESTRYSAVFKFRQLSSLLCVRVKYCW